MTSGAIIKTLRGLESQGYRFTLQPDGRFQVTPTPGQDSPVFKFCAKNADAIKLELWLRPKPIQGEATFVQQAALTFGNPKVIEQRSYEQILEDFVVCMEANKADLGTAFAVLARFIGHFQSTGQLVQAEWAIRAFAELGENAMVHGTLQGVLRLNHEKNPIEHKHIP